MKVDDVEKIKKMWNSNPVVKQQVEAQLVNVESIMPIANGVATKDPEEKHETKKNDKPVVSTVQVVQGPKMSKRPADFKSFQRAINESTREIGHKTVFDLLKATQAEGKYSLILQLDEILQGAKTEKYAFMQITECVFGVPSICTSFAWFLGLDGTLVPYLNLGKDNILVSVPAEIARVSWNLVAKAYIEHFNNPDSHVCSLAHSCTFGIECFQKHVDEICKEEGEHSTDWPLRSALPRKTQMKHKVRHR